MNATFTLTLFSTQPDFIRRAVAAGVSEVIVDWESRGKQARQQGADTQINHDTLTDLERVRACTRARVLCRINPHGETTRAEVAQATAAGADEILLPMVRSPAEVERVLSLAQGRVGVGILVETRDALHELAALAALPLSRVYVGLNDLAIERRSPTIFAAVADGTLEHIRHHFTVPFGFGGLTLPERGHPIPCRLLIDEMARLDCHFSFLRRSFHRDLEGLDFQIHVPRIVEAMARARARSPTEIASSQRDLAAAIRARLPLPRAVAPGDAS